MRTDAPRVLFVVTEDWYFVLHWLGLARAVKRAGYRVAVATRVHSHADHIRESGVELIALDRLRRSSLNPLREAAAVGELVRILERWRPSIVHLVALKPIIYGALATRFGRRCAYVNALAGLGFVFLQDTGLARLLRPLVKQLLRLALGGQVSLTTVQNPDDRALLVSQRLVDPGRVRLIPGAGIDLLRFAHVPLPTGRPLVVLMSRLLWDKGVAEFVEAANLVRQRGLDARFALVGEPDDENPAAVPRSRLREWSNDGGVEWWGYRADAPAVLAQASIVVLPSYREGLPTVLAEASAIGRPMVATDVPGCRDVVRHGESGLLVGARDPVGLAAAIGELLANPERCREMGQRARVIAEREFSIDAVVSSTLDVYRELQSQCPLR
ncbi:MAG: glycosyltransferase family 4 protein [Burkholderiales bacterium]|nr:glycosyltransferase family 4 protein [Burkholderiales bacterium]